MSIEWNPHVDKDGNCVNCGTGQLNFDGKSTGCACSRVADAEYEEMQRIIKLLEELLEERSGVNLQGAVAILKAENNGTK